MVLIVMGVAGSGKTTVGKTLAERLGWEFHDADDLHPPANREKMRLGVPLDDEDRRPWLETIRALVASLLADKRSGIIACSALKESYRRRLRIDLRQVKLVYLKGPRELIELRLAARRGHFFDPKLLANQFADLEEPTDAIDVSIEGSLEEIAASIAQALRL